MFRIVFAILIAAVVASCAGDDPAGPNPQPTGAIAVTISTTGSNLPTRYTVVVDGGASQLVDANGRVTFSGFSAATHAVELTSVPDNCSVTSANPVSVSVVEGQTVPVAMTVQCAALVGDLLVSSVTTGEDLDPDGFQILVDGAPQQSIGINASRTLTGLSVGPHQVGLDGVASNCSMSGTNPRTVNVLAAADATVTFNVSCAARAGSIRVATNTAGEDPDPDGYTLRVDDGPPQSIGTSASTVLSGLSVGPHTVSLEGVAGNCSVTGENPRAVEVTFGQQADVEFAITCSSSTGSLRVVAATTGSDLDPDGYALRIDGAIQGTVASSGETRIDGLATGTRQLSVEGIAENCDLAGANPRSVTIEFGQTADVQLDIACSPDVGGLRVSASTTGTDLDPDGYEVRIDGSQARSLGINGQVLYTGLTSGPHQLSIEGIADNCALSGSNPRTVNVEFDQTTNVGLSVVCEPIPGPIITTTSLPDSYFSRLYDVQLEVESGTPPYTWSLLAGRLPGNLKLDSDGLISGTVGEILDPGDPPDEYEIEFRVSDALGRADTASLTLTVSDVCPQGWSYFSYDFTITEGESLESIDSGIDNQCPAPYEWRAIPEVDWIAAIPSSGILPPSGFVGIEIALNVEDLPPGNYSGGVEFDLGAEVEFGTVNVEVLPRLSIATVDLPTFWWNREYQAALTASGGTGPLTWSLVSGSLPPGTSLSSNGVISGLVRILFPGEYTFTVGLEDGAGRRTQKQFDVYIEDCGNPNPPGLLEFYVQEGVTPAPQTFTLTNGGCGSFPWYAISEDNADWVTVEPMSGTVGPEAPAVVTVSIDPARLDREADGASFLFYLGVVVEAMMVTYYKVP